MNLVERFGLGLKAWYLAWFVEGEAEKIDAGLTGRGLPAPQEPDRKPDVKPTDKPARKPERLRSPTRSDALTLLETLQRESRLIDFLKEDIGLYQDAQIGAAVRDIHRDAGKVLERLFALRNVLEEAEGTTVTVQPDAAARIRLVGNVRDDATSGTLVHAGWMATKVELPSWSGPNDGERIVAPAEVEVT